MNMQKKRASHSILAAKEHLFCTHLSDLNKGILSEGTCYWDEIFATLAAIKFNRELAMESFINMPKEISYGLSIRRLAANSAEEVGGKELPFLRNKADHYELI